MTYCRIPETALAHTNFSRRLTKHRHTCSRIRRSRSGSCGLLYTILLQLNFSETGSSDRCNKRNFAWSHTDHMR